MAAANIKVKINNINLVTHNHNKLKEFKHVLEPAIAVEHIDFEYPELRSENNIEIAEMAAKQISDALKMPVVVEDSGFFIDALNGFPGTSSAYIHKRIGLKGVLKLMKGVKNRKCFYKSAVSYCEPGKNPVSFLGVEEGRVALREKGKYGWGHDPIFMPKGRAKTYGELKKEWKGPSLFRKKAIMMLKEYLINKNLINKRR